MINLGKIIGLSLCVMEASGELAKGKKWASNTGEPIRGYVLEPR